MWGGDSLPTPSHRGMGLEKRVGSGRGCTPPENCDFFYNFAFWRLLCGFINNDNMQLYSATVHLYVVISVCNTWRLLQHNNTFQHFQGNAASVACPCLRAPMCAPVTTHGFYSYLSINLCLLIVTPNLFVPITYILGCIMHIA